MKQHWSLADVLDLEFFLSQDQDLIDRGSESDLAERDRSIYLHIKDSCKPELSSADRACLLQEWLSRRRSAFFHDAGVGVVLPGVLFQELTRICAWGFFLFTLAVGWGLALSFLSYSGTTPVNVSIFLALFVGSQLLFLSILLISFTVGRLIGSASLPVTYALLRKGILHLAVKLGRLPAATNAHRWLAGLSGKLRQRKRSYGLLFALPFFLLMQLGGIGFNLGVLAATLLKVVGTDIAFGWQSTLQLSAEAVYHMVQIVALPWSWAISHVGSPDLAQVRGSQMVLKNGIYHLTTEDLVSWWPFLCLAVAFYGLLPRVCLLLAGWFANRSLLRRLEFDTALQQQLLHRMLTPRLSTESKAEIPSVEKEEEPELSEHVHAPQVSGKVLALVPDEIFDDCVRSELAQMIQARLGLQLARCLRINQEGEGERQVLLEIRREFLPDMDSLLLLQEAWQPPIEEFFFFVQQVRELLEVKVLFSIVLIGKPSAETILTKVGEQDYSIWQQKVVSLGDPYLQCVRLVVS